jgi:hypothetical protein
MTFKEWAALSEGDQKDRCQKLDPYDDKDVFQGVENSFKRDHGDQSDIGSIECGLGPFIGPYNSIVVKVTGRKREKGFPREYMGFPVLIEKQ